MIRGHGRSPGSLGSPRSSLTGVGFMPVIAENEVAQTPPSPTNTVFGNGSLPHSGSPPLRIPLKNPRRGSPASMSQQRGLPPPYVPPYIMEPLPTLHHPPPRYTKEDAEIVEQESSQTGEGKGRRKLADRWCCVLGIVVALLVIIAVGLAIGLTIGLKDQHDKDNHGSSSSGDNESSDQSFPAGSFAFEVHLQDTSTNCTSNPSTWRCYPYTTGDSATFFWVITAQDTASSSKSFNISSTDNPFAPSFTDRPLTVLDAGKPTERLHFSFSMTKTVVPSDKLTANNRAASCSFADTVFEATLWTRQRGDGTVDEDESEPADVKFGDWPRNAEIVQTKDSQLGQPKCEDSNGNAIADVQAESGICKCQYANFDD